MRWAEIGWPAYKEGELFEVIANGVDRTCIETAATIFELSQEASNLKRSVNSHSSKGHPLVSEFLSNFLLLDVGVCDRLTAVIMLSRVN